MGSDGAGQEWVAHASAGATAVEKDAFGQRGGYMSVFQLNPLQAPKPHELFETEETKYLLKPAVLGKAMNCCSELTAAEGGRSLSQALTLADLVLQTWKQHRKRNNT